MFNRLSTTRRVLGVRGLAMVQKPALPASYGNFINGKFEEPIDGQYFDNISPIDGKVFIKAARSNQKDVAMAVDAASEAMKTWKNVSVTERSNMLLKIADIIEQNLETLATLESMDNGKVHDHNIISFFALFGRVSCV
jgi:aldehyde dehydrogenase (NAD+)/aldehyde dehydrogenase